MKSMMTMLTAVALAALGGAAAGAAERKALFNGKDLSGWTAVADYDVTGGYAAAEPPWFVHEGAIRTAGTPFGYLRTKRTDFKDFRLHLEYRWWRRTEKPNSGVFVGITSENGAFLPNAVENQLCAGRAGDFVGLAGRRLPGCSPRDEYDPARPLSGISVAPRKGEDAEKPFGEWNVLEVELRNGRLSSRVNGLEVNALEGIGACRGALALQSEGGAVEFRNVWIEE